MNYKDIIILLLTLETLSYGEAVSYQCTDRISTWLCGRLVRWKPESTCTHAWWSPVKDFLCCQSCRDNGYTIQPSPTTTESTTETIPTKRTTAGSSTSHPITTEFETTESVTEETHHHVTNEPVTEEPETTEFPPTEPSDNQTTNQPTMTTQEAETRSDQRGRKITKKMSSTTVTAVPVTTILPVTTVETTVPSTTTVAETSTAVPSTTPTTTTPTISSTTTTLKTSSTTTSTTSSTTTTTTTSTTTSSSTPTTSTTTPTTSTTTQTTPTTSITTITTTTTPPIRYKVILIGGNPSEQLMAMEEFHPDQPSKNKINNLNLNLPRRSFAAGLFVTTGWSGVVLAGGVNGNMKHQTSTIYDLTWNSVYAGPLMKYKHGFTTGTVVGNRFYVCAGADDVSYYTGYCEFWQKDRWQWYPIQSLTPGRLGATAASLNGVLYMIGGRSSSGVLQMTQRYHPQTNRWYYTANTVKPRYKAGACALNSMIYVCGGWELQRAQWVLSTSCEVYVPSDDKWYYTTSMNIGRAGFALVQYEGKLLALGGSLDSNTGRSVEEYNPKTQRWTIMNSKLLGPRHDFSAVVVQD